MPLAQIKSFKLKAPRCLDRNYNKPSGKISGIYDGEDISHLGERKYRNSQQTAGNMQSFHRWRLHVNKIQL